MWQQCVEQPPNPINLYPSNYYENQNTLIYIFI
jgi:hypothetical protein